jgi:hypothetical protein
MKNYLIIALLVTLTGYIQPIFGQINAQLETGTFTDNTVLAYAGGAMEEVYGVSLGNSTAQTTANGYTFAVDSSSNISYNISGSYSSFLGGGGTSGDTALDSVLNHGRVGGGTGTLVLNNLAQGVTYRVLFLLADTRSGVGARTFSITQGGATSPSQQYAYVAGTPSLGGYVLYTFTATGMTQTFTVNQVNGHQLNAVLVCCVGANTPFKTIEAEWGTLGGAASVVSLPSGTLPTVHTEALEASGRSYVHLVSVGDSVIMTNNTSVTSNTIVVRVCIPDAPTGGGINATLDLYVNGVFRQVINLTSAYTWTYNGGWNDNAPSDGTPQRFFDEARAFITGAPIAPGSTITLEKDSTNTASFYDIDCMEMENVGSALTQPANTLSVANYGAVAGSGGLTYLSPSQQFAYLAGSPSLGGYVLCTFTATGPNQSFNVNNSYGCQLNGLLVCSGGTPPSSPQFATGTFTNNTVLAQAGSTANEVYGVSLGNSTAQTTANGYSFAVDSSSNISYSVSGSYSNFLGGGGTSGDTALDAVLKHGRTGSGTGMLVLNNLTSGVTYQALFLLADTRSGVGVRTFNITEGPSNAIAFQNCINAAKTAGEGVWIPAGTYYINQQLNASAITISGAGKWYSTLYYEVTGNNYFAFSTTDCNISNLYLDSNSIGRDAGTQGIQYGINMTGTVGWVVQNVWVHNLIAAFWMSGTHGTIENCRVGNGWADGINLGSSGQSGQGVNMVIQNNFIRGGDDDAIALNQQNGLGSGGNIVGVQILNNSSIAETGANGLRLAGGRSTVVENNLVCDPTEEDGIHAGTFGVNANPLESALIQNNIVIRGRGIKGAGALWVGSSATNVISQDNIYCKSLGAGITLSSCNVTLTNEVIDHPANQGIWIQSSSTGTAAFNDCDLLNLNAGQNALENDSSSTYTVTKTGNTGF